MTASFKFSSVCGENIKLSDHSKTATWQAKDSGAWVCSAASFELGQTVVVQFEGSCHSELGFIKEDPKVANMTKTVFQRINDIRIHKRTCVVNVSLNPNGTEISSQFQDKTFKKSIEQNVKAWLTAYVKFGEVTVRLLRNGSPDDAIQFSENHGANIELQNHRRLARTVLQAPGTLCFVKEKITVGQTLTFLCSPILEDSREPSRYHVKLQVNHKNPESLKQDFKYLFDATSQYTSDPPVTTLELLEKQDCNGTLMVTVVNSSTVRYQSASGKFNEQTLHRSATDGVWVMLSLFRTRVSIVKYRSGSMDQVDACVREPTNELEKNTMDVYSLCSAADRTEPKRCGSDYSIVCAPSTPENDDLTIRLTNLERCHDALLEKQKATEQTLQRLCSVVSLGTVSVSGASDKNIADERKINVQPNYRRLVSDIDGPPLRDLLFEKTVITKEELEQIACTKTPTDSNRKLLSILMKKDVKKSDMDKLLEESEQGHLKNLF